MTPEELLAKIKTGNEFLGIKYAPDSHTFALRRIVELCRKWDRKGSYCLPIEDIIQAIERELK